MKRKGIYLSPEFVEAFTNMLKESSKEMRKTRREMHKKYPELYGGKPRLIKKNKWWEIWK